MVFSLFAGRRPPRSIHDLALPRGTCLALGLATPVSAAIVFVTLTPIHHRTTAIPRSRTGATA
jgi:hypothetical protein